MSNSQNKKNEQQNNLCTTLTEQWKKGELKAGMYYIKYKGSGKLDWWHGYYWEDSWSENVEEVLAPVPSYEEWQQLKELLKEGRGLLDNYNHTFETKDWEKSSNLITKIDNAIGGK